MCLSVLIQMVILVCVNGGSTQQEGDLRLVGGQNSGEGRVEIFFNSSWKGVCDDSWTDEDAVVVCRQLNLPWTGAEMVTHGEFEPGNETYVLDSVRCTGDEQSLRDCPHYTTSNCHIGREDAGVRCMDRVLPVYRNGSGEVRLVNDYEENNRSGRVEVKVNGNWSVVCENFWSMADARVVCRQLGFRTNEYSAATLRAASGTQPGIVGRFLCCGNETELLDCHHSHDALGYGRCRHAGVACLPVVTDVPEGSVRLVGSSQMSGRLEVLFNNVWGTVCAGGTNSFTRRTADVACRQLNFTGAEGRVLEHSNYELGVGPIWLAEVSCVGNESSLLECSNSSVTDCSHLWDVGVACYNYSECRTGAIRLVNGSSPREGRVEMCYRDAWSTICHTSWDSRDARQVCRQLNLPSTAALPFKNAFFGEGNGKISYSRIRCTNPSGRTLYDDCRFFNSARGCTHAHDAGVRCQDLESLETGSADIRLVDGRNLLEGRVEVLLDGRWGTVCANEDWNASAAATVCRQLGAPTEGSKALLGSAFGPGSSDQPIHYSNFRCSGSEVGLLACTFSFSSSSCNHGDDASVICTSPPAPVPQNLLVDLSSSECGRATFTWTNRANVDTKIQSFFHYELKIISINSSELVERVWIPIGQTSHSLSLQCDGIYIGYITSYVFDLPGNDSNIVAFKTNSSAPPPPQSEGQRLSAGVLAVVIMIPVIMLIIMGAAAAAIVIVACARGKKDNFTRLGSSSCSSGKASCDYTLEGEL